MNTDKEKIVNLDEPVSSIIDVITEIILSVNPTDIEQEEIIQTQQQTV